MISHSSIAQPHSPYLHTVARTIHLDTTLILNVELVLYFIKFSASTDLSRNNALSSDVTWPGATAPGRPNWPRF